MKKHRTIISSIIILSGLLVISSTELNAQKVKKLLYKGKTEKAEGYCKSLETEEEQIACLTEMADYYLYYHSYEKAEVYYIKAGKKEEGIKKIGDKFFEKEEYPKANEYYEKAFSENKEKMQEHYMKIGERYLELKKLGSAKIYYEKAKTQEGYERLGDYHFSTGIDYYDPAASDPGKNRKSSIQIFKNAIFYYEKAFKDNKHEKIKKCNSKIGDIWFDNREIWRAESYYASAEDKNGFEKVGIYYYKKGNYVNAEKNIKKAYKDDKAKLSEYYKKVGDTYYESKDYIKAADYYAKAFKDDKVKLNERYKAIADTYYSSKDYMNAAQYYAKADLKVQEEKCYAHFYKKFKDPRDLKTYKYIMIGDQYWMAENMAYKADKGCWAYKYSSDNVKKYGYLYNWETAKKVCPLGWHLPTRQDFVTLLNNYGDGSQYNEENYEALANDKLGLQIQFAGEREYNKKFENMGQLGYLWTSTWADSYDDINVAYGIQIRKEFKDGGIAKNTNTESGKSVRCVKD